MSAIAKIYVKKILNGELELEQVPPRWKEEVQNELEQENNK